MEKRSATIQSVIQSRQDREVFSGKQKHSLRQHISHHIDQQSAFSSQPSHVSSRILTWKWLVSGVVLASIFGVLYGIWGLPADSVIFDNPVFTLLRSNQTTSVPRALASSVGQVIIADGSYSIVNDGVTYTTNMIYDGDTIELASHARLSFMVDGHQAYIVGPASVHITSDGDGYRFTMVDGEFLEVFSARADAGSRLTVEMRDIILAHNAHDTTMKVQLSTDASGETIVKNYADPVLVARADDSTDTKDLGSETQLTIAPSSSIASATESRFSVSDVAFVSDVSSVIDEGEAVLLSLIPTAVDDEVIPTTDSRIDGVISAVEGTTGVVADIPSVTLTTTDVSDPMIATVVADRILPTESQLASLRQLVATDVSSLDRVWDRVAMSYDCERLPVDAAIRTRIVSSCVQGLLDGYYLPPSLSSSLQAWLDAFVGASVTHTPSDATVESGSSDSSDSAEHIQQ